MIRKAGLVILVCILFLGTSTFSVIQASVVEHTEEAFSPTVSSLRNNHYDLLIIAPSEFIDALQPLVSHKENHGVKTKMIMLNEIYNGSYFTTQGRDDAEKVKYFIKNALDEWNITYVLMVGGRKHGIYERWYVPVRYVTISTFGWSAKILSDLYFADIYDDEGVFQSWDTNEDDAFGNLDDHMDLHPDVCVGRWACRDKIEVKTMVKKTIAYESKTEKTKKIVLIGGDTFKDPPTEYDEGELITTESAKCLPDYEPVKVYSSEKTVSASEIKEALGEGASFMHFKGHGWVIYWSTYKHGQVYTTSEPGLGIWNIPLFSNTQYPIVVFGGCHTAMFNVSVTNRPGVWSPYYNLPKILMFFPAVESISWFFNRKIDGGSVASLGYTWDSFSAYGERGDLDHDGVTEPDCIEAGSGIMEINFFCAYGEKNKTHLGECWRYTEDNYIDTQIDAQRTHITDFTNAECFVLLGDPSLKIGGYS